MGQFLKQKMKEIQSKFNFEIPDYVLEEIIIGNKENLRALIGLAKVNNRFSESQANILILIFCRDIKNFITINY
ncbi:MAG: hypothetical protein J6J60_04100 [Clostridia bacterium]|nr:hypothetical protein [Clostridia bacterium]MBP3596565.1 hypothetical protein [Clostridia bacterium]